MNTEVQIISRNRIFGGWWIVLTSMVGMAFSSGAVLVFTFGVFAKPMATDLKVSRASIASAFWLLDIVQLFAMPGAGRLVDRWGARGVIVASLIGLSLGLIGLALVQPPLWHLGAVYALVGCLGAGTTPVTHARVMANWFDRRRGLALGLASSGVGFGALVTPSFAQALIDRGGWRLAYVGLAVACMAIAVPIVALFLRGKPEDVGLNPDGAASLARVSMNSAYRTGLTVREAFGTLTFWKLCFIAFCAAACVGGANSHFVPLLTDAGISGRSAALASSVFGAAVIAGRIGNGYLVDRLFAPRVAALIFGGAAVGIAVLWSGAAVTASVPAAVLLGLALGAEGDVLPFLVSRYFGMRAMAEIFGCVFGAVTMGFGAGRYLFAAGYDFSGSYRMPLAFAFGVLILVIVACLGLGKYEGAGRPEVTHA